MTLVRRVVFLLPILLLFVLITSCNGFFVSDSSIQSVTVTPSAVLLKAAAAAATPGDSYQLASSSTTVGSTSADDTATATWSSSSTDVTVVKGLITAIGTAATPSTAPITVTAKDGGATSNTCSVLLYVVPTPTSLFVVGTNLATAGAAPGTYQFHAYLGPDATFPEVTNFVTWSSDTPAAATVNATTGLVTVLSVLTPTSVTITAKASVGATPTAENSISGTLPFTAD